ncbi:uncharacterized protein CTHT_0040580 [Thermochaetoides thermophila DSM 1495]|uniref:Velvet domain-containing protein n=1 Tax=Chaetomium thermophilum (strain DSM 1495 / CBS 144.50 / IMI 039719) TaxID=759272 RepID=G0SA08_CHATD|nr:hypothetical protein CTHT_0040580 [Thermochaetoides thermophila DSM 1495]EGS19580.1 hypothetical protein CTHT_0040580 [Thermochaetoides thermophila DSM 1495]
MMLSSLSPNDYELRGTERKPIDPPPIVRLLVNPRKDPNRTFLQNPYLILTARLIPKGDDEPDSGGGPKESDLTGTLVSSLYSLKDTDNTQGGFFVFGDLSVRRVGTYRLLFMLYELRLADKECWLLSRTVSDPFIVYATKSFPGLAESTFLTRSFSDQGVRLRLRKDSRSVSSKKRSLGMATQDQMRPPQGSYGYLPHDTSHDLSSPNGSTHHLRQLDRTRSAIGSQSGYYGDSPQMRPGEYGSGSYGYSSYDDKPTKRARLDGAPDDSPHGYESDYHPYAQAGPRTVPDPLTSIYPMSTSYPVPAQPALAGLPMPSPYGSIPRLDTQHLPPHSPAAPTSATSTFSPEPRRSPVTSYPYGTQHTPTAPPPPAMFAAPTAPTSLPYHAANPAPLPHPNGLGIALPGMGLEAVKD